MAPALHHVRMERIYCKEFAILAMPIRLGTEQPVKFFAEEG